jgi:hypothetical protein
MAGFGHLRGCMIVRRWNAVWLVVILLVGCTSSQPEADIRGTIIDASSGKALRGVVVAAQGSETHTDRDGEFVLVGVREGSKVTATICSHQDAVLANVRNLDEPNLDLGEIELRPVRTKIHVTSNLTGKGVKSRLRGGARGVTHPNGRGVVRGLCPGATLRVEADGYESTKIEVKGQAKAEVVLSADPATTAEYIGELESRGRISAEWDLVHPDVKAYASEDDYLASVNRDVRAGYQLISIEAKSFKIIRWVFPACEYSDFGPKTYPRTAAVEAIYHSATPRGGGSTERTVTHWVQTKDGFWRWFPNVGCSFLPP